MPDSCSSKMEGVMTKHHFSSVCILLAILLTCSTFLCGCNAQDGNENNQNQTPGESVEYTIQYVDDEGIHSITVKDGELYSIEKIPQRLGYEFLGLFDAEVGGTQYISPDGISLSPFTDKKNLVLFPHWKAKEYTLILDFGGADITGARNYSVRYGEKLPELPKNLILEHSTFLGWYTQKNCNGIQVADQHGLFVDKSFVDENTFDIDASTKFLYLYAGFETETFTVTFNFGNGIPQEEMEVAYNTPVSEVVPDTRNNDGFAVLAWSKTQSGSQIFTGNITDDTVLYAVEWAPVIEFDTNGGEDVKPIVAREGEAISIPDAVRGFYTFIGWYTQDDEKFEKMVMPSESIRLYAKWWAQIQLDGRGGGQFDMISQEAGTPLVLPVPQKKGYIFAGWYSEDNEKIELTLMPSESIRLRAMYYEVKTEKVTVLSSGTMLNLMKYSTNKGLFTLKANDTIRVDFAKAVTYIDWTHPQNFTVDFHVEICDGYDEIWGDWSYKGCRNAYFEFYSVNNTSSAYQIGSYTYENNSTRLDVWRTLSFTMDLPIQDGAAYFFFSADFESVGGKYPGEKYGVRIRDMWAEIQIPDTTKLV